MVDVQQGDRSAYEALYARWRDPIQRFLLRRTGSLASAEEALQETWMRVYRHRARYDATRPFRRWLYGIAANAGHDAARPQADVFVLPAEPGDPIGLRDTLVSALHGLEAGDRRLLLLAVEGFEPAEIAEMLELPSGTVRMRLSRARERVRAAVEADHA